MTRGRTYVRFRQLGDQLLLVGKRLLRLPRANKGVYETGEVLLDPCQAPVELAELPRGHDDEPIALLGELDERIVCPGNWGRNVDVVCLPKLFDLAEGRKRVKSFSVGARNRLLPKHAAFTKSDTVLVCGTDEGHAAVFDVSAASVVQRLEGPYPNVQHIAVSGSLSALYLSSCRAGARKCNG